MADKKKNAPLPASSAGLLRFFEDETKGVKVNPKIIIMIPLSLIVLSWALELFLAPKLLCLIQTIFKIFTDGTSSR